MIFLHFAAFRSLLLAFASGGIFCIDFAVFFQTIHLICNCLKSYVNSHIVPGIFLTAEPVRKHRTNQRPKLRICEFAGDLQHLGKQNQGFLLFTSHPSTSVILCICPAVGNTFQLSQQALLLS